MAATISPFLNGGTVASTDSLAIIHLSRDSQIAAILRERDDEDEGYREGKVINTKYGSYPHTTLIGLPWGSQVRATNVDTGSRGRRTKGGKRKREESEPQDSEQQDKPTETASSGFIHLLQPTPENWTASLPHRTQVVYTPDYSYVLHRLRVRPGTRIIEAGAGSGSFTHASARAVYSGYPSREGEDGEASAAKRRKSGKVWSYEFHEQRHEKLTAEIRDHGLEGIVQITHRDVCQDGFLVGPDTNESPEAEAIFLDLPAPWLALPHLSRRPVPRKSGMATPETVEPQTEQKPFRSPLDPNAPTRICTFSPCIEQVQRTVSAMRRLGWVDISTEEVMHKRIEIRRERIGIENGQQRGVLPVAANVEEAVARLKEVEGRFKDYHGSSNEDKDVNGHEESAKKEEKSSKQNPNSREKILQSLGERKIYMEGRLTHRTEPEVKTHTSYLTFAVLPQEWNEEEEEAARAKWPVKKKEAGMDKPGSNRQQKKAARQNLNRAKGSATAKDSADAPEAQQAAVVGESAETETKEDPMSIDSILS